MPKTPLWLYCIPSVDTSSTRELQWLKYYKTGFLKTPNALLRMLSVEIVTYTSKRSTVLQTSHVYIHTRYIYISGVIYIYNILT